MGFVQKIMKSWVAICHIYIYILERERERERESMIVIYIKISFTHLKLSTLNNNSSFHKKAHLNCLSANYNGEFQYQGSEKSSATMR